MALLKRFSYLFRSSWAFSSSTTKRNSNVTDGIVKFDEDPGILAARKKAAEDIGETFKDYIEKAKTIAKC
jgi:hypothetical protein